MFSYIVRLLATKAVSQSSPSPSLASSSVFARSYASRGYSCLQTRPLVSNLSPAHGFALASLNKASLSKEEERKTRPFFPSLTHQAHTPLTRPNTPAAPSLQPPAPPSTPVRTHCISPADTTRRRNYTAPMLFPALSVSRYQSLRKRVRRRGA